MEWIESGIRNKVFWERFGKQLAALHQNSNEFFGLPENNYMGSVIQLNDTFTDWVIFFKEKRLQPVISKCFDSGYFSLSKHLGKFDRLYTKLPGIFDDNQSPVLVHGDLWSGNFMCNQDIRSCFDRSGCKLCSSISRPWNVNIIRRF